MVSATIVPTAARLAEPVAAGAPPPPDGRPQLAIDPCAAILLLMEDAARLQPPPSADPRLGAHLDTYL